MVGMVVHANETNAPLGPIRQTKLASPDLTGFFEKVSNRSTIGVEPRQHLAVVQRQQTLRMPITDDRLLSSLGGE